MKELFNNGKIIYYNESIDRNKELKTQVENLLEDLIQVEYKDGEYLIDIGWYPECNVNGEFQLRLIKKNNWNNPELLIKNKKNRRIKDRNRKNNQKY